MHSDRRRSRSTHSRIKRNSSLRRSLERLEPRLLLDAGWQNTGQPLDVNDDLFVTPADVLVGVNRLNLQGGGFLDSRPADSELPFVDTNGDGGHSSNDILTVINALNSGAPHVAGRLANDTAPGGATNGDKITSDAAFIVNVTSRNSVTVFAGIDDTPRDHFVEITQTLDAGSFQLDADTLDAIAETPLEDGGHELHIVATDESGVDSEIESFFFSLDRRGALATNSKVGLSRRAVSVELTERVTTDNLDLSGVQLISLGEDGSVDGGDDSEVAIAALETRWPGDQLDVISAVDLASGNYRLLLNDKVVTDIAGNETSLQDTFDFTVQPNEQRAASGVARDADFASANAGETIRFPVPWDAQSTRIQISTGDTSHATVDAFGERDSNVSYVTLPDNTLTSDVTVYVPATEEFNGLTGWEITRSTVDLIGTDEVGESSKDELPGNGLYLNLAGSPGGARLESPELDLQPGWYELQFDLAGSERRGQNTVRVMLGESYAENFTRSTVDEFTSIRQAIYITEASTERLVIDHSGNGSDGARLDDVQLTFLSDGTTLLADDFEFSIPGGGFPLQIVPTVEAVNLSVNRSTAWFELTGTGLTDGPGTHYTLGGEEIVDDTTADTTVFSSPTAATIQLESFYERDPFGVTQVSTLGGTSEPFSVRLFELESVSLTGTPADSELPSANVGQAVTLYGTQLSETTDISVRGVNRDGELSTWIVNPHFVSADGTQASFFTPANGVVDIQVPGSPDSLPLQIVPTVVEATVGGNISTILATGVIDGDTVYRHGSVSIPDTGGEGSPVVVPAGGDTTSTRFTAPIHGFGELSVNTAGGTSNTRPINFVFPSLGPLDAVARDSVSDDLFVIADSRIVRVDPSDGASEYVGELSVVPGDLHSISQPLMLNGVSLPAGSLLVFTGDGLIHAINPADGAVLTTLDPEVEFDATGGVYHPGTDTLFVLNRGQSEIIELDPGTGSEVSRFATPLPILGDGGLAVDPTSGNLYATGNSQDPLVEISADGTLVRVLSLSPSVTGLAWGDDAIYTSNERGAIFRIDAEPPTQPLLVLEGIVGRALDGTVANQDSPSANAGQTIELIGQNFSPETTVSFLTRDFQGQISRTTVEPVVVSADGTRLQVNVPENAETGDVAVSSPGLAATDIVFDGYEDSIYRDIQLAFTAESNSTVIELASLSDELSENAWGFDNFQIRRATDDQPIFSDDFEAGPDPAWSLAQTDRSAPGVLSEFSGPFKIESQSITLETEPGRAYELELDVYIFDAKAGQRLQIVAGGKALFAETFGTHEQTFGSISGGSLPLQIVPVIELSRHTSSGPGFNRPFLVAGSGFLGGRSTVTVDGLVINRHPDDQGGNGILNQPRALEAPLSLHGPIRVETPGGSDEVSSPAFRSDGFIRLDAIEAVAELGVPAAKGPAANTGQEIVLIGLGFTEQTWVQFDAVDDRGSSGKVTRQGTPSSDGTRLHVIVPALAKTGTVSVVGDDAQLPLQIVPTLRSVGGSVLPGHSILLEGTGLPKGQLSVAVDGTSAEVQAVTTITDEGIDQQFADVVVPTGVSQGVITVVTDGGTYSLIPDDPPKELPRVVTSSDIGGTSLASHLLPLSSNTRVTVESTIGDDGTDRDVDLFEFPGQEGSRLSIGLQFQGVDDARGFIRLFDSSGQELFSTNSRRIITLPATDTYYVGVSGWRNRGYNLEDNDRASRADTGDYVLHIQQMNIASRSLKGIDSIAPRGTPKREYLASANTGQEITISGSAIPQDARVVFSTVDAGSSELESIVVKATEVAADGTRLQVQVPPKATTGMVRLEREGTGVFLQVVPTVNQVRGASEQINRRFILGSGFPEGQLVVHFGDLSLVDRTAYPNGADVSNLTHSGRNDKIDISVGEALPAGPIFVTTPGGTSDSLNITFTGIDSVALSGTPVDISQPSANPGQAITIRGTNLDYNTNVVFLARDFNRIEEHVVTPVDVISDEEVIVIVPDDAMTANVQVVGDQSNSQVFLQIVPILTNVDLSLPRSGPSFHFLGAGLTDRQAATYRIGNQVIHNVPATGRLDTYLSEALFGSVTITTQGGTSEPFEVRVDELESVALSGIPADPSESSANPGQFVTVRGTGLRESTQAVIRYLDERGDRRATVIEPTLTNIEGTTAIFQVPNAIGTTEFLVVGSAQRPLLQIVPRGEGRIAAGAPELLSLGSTALDGTPADPSVASANVSQVVELVGANFTRDSRVLFPTRSFGAAGIESVAPTGVSDDGSRLQVVVPQLAETGDIRVVEHGAGGTNLGFGSFNDSIYRNIELTFTAETDIVEFTFFAAGGSLRGPWGIDNVRVVQQSNTQTVFEEDFENGADAAWLHAGVEDSRVENFTKFSGAFEDESQLLAIELFPGESYALQFDLYVIDRWDGESDEFFVQLAGQTIFRESFSTFADDQSFSVESSAALPLQIVPTLRGITGRPGERGNPAKLIGSGFIDGAITVEIGGLRLVDAPFDDDLRVQGKKNDTYEVASEVSLNGPIRIETAGGSATLPGPIIDPPTYVRLYGIDATAKSGIPAGPGASANTGQRITLDAAGTGTAWVEFPAVDETGTPGTIVRSGIFTGERTLSVRVPALARTGSIRIIGDPTEMPLQIVPTLGSVGGEVSPGGSILLAGTGLPVGDVEVMVDGKPSLDPVEVITVVENLDSRPDSQLASATVPAQVDRGIVTVTTSGGSFTLLPEPRRDVLPDIDPVEDAGETYDSAFPVTLPLDGAVTIAESIGDQDVDLYRLDLTSGDRLTVIAEEPITFDGWGALQIFDSAGEVEWGTIFRSDQEATLDTFAVGSTDTYYLAVSGWPNLDFDPRMSNSGRPGDTGDYRIAVHRVDEGRRSIQRIEATAALGTPRAGNVASAIVGQTITLVGSGFTSQDKVQFGRSYHPDLVKEPVSVSEDGTRLTVVVPRGAVTGTVRLEREGSGILLQVVPAIESVRKIGGTLYPSATGLDGRWTTHVGEVAIVNRATSGSWSVPSLPGAVTISTVGGTSAAAVELSPIVSTAAVGTPADPLLASANPLQEITLIGRGFGRYTEVAFSDVNGFRTVDPAAIVSDTELTVVVPEWAVTGPVYVVGSEAVSLQIVPTLSRMTLNWVSELFTRISLFGSGLIDGQGTTYQIAHRTVIDSETDRGPIEVDDNHQVAKFSLALGLQPRGRVTVSTAGGTSNAFPLWEGVSEGEGDRRALDEELFGSEEELGELIDLGL